jgi:predicted porin
LIEKEHKSNVKSISVAPKRLDPKPSIKCKDLRVYATVRPTFGYIDENDEKLWDVRDALSHAGFKATTHFDEEWSAVLHGEWGIDLSNNGDFGKARQVYIALNSPVGTIGIGKKRPAQYLFIAEYVDIFNHSNSPFSYDPESIFFVDNLITYKLKTGNLTWMLA